MRGHVAALPLIPLMSSDIDGRSAPAAPLLCPVPSHPRERRKRRAAVAGRPSGPRIPVAVRRAGRVAARARRRRAHATAVGSGARHGDDRAAGARRRRLAHPADRPARPDRQLPRSRQPPWAGVVLHARPVLPIGGLDGVRARARQRRDQQRDDRPRGVDRAPPGRAHRSGRVRCARRSGRARLRHDRADPPVEPVLPRAAVAARARRRMVGADGRLLDGDDRRRRRLDRGPDTRAVSAQRARDLWIGVGHDGVADAPARCTTHRQAPADRIGGHRRRHLGAGLRRSADPRPWQHPHAGSTFRVGATRAGDRARHRRPALLPPPRRTGCDDRPVPPRRRLRAPVRSAGWQRRARRGWCSSSGSSPPSSLIEAGTCR